MKVESDTKNPMYNTHMHANNAEHGATIARIDSPVPVTAQAVAKTSYGKPKLPANHSMVGTCSAVDSEGCPPPSVCVKNLS